MLYINEYTKPQMDRSTRSLVEAYRLKIEGLNFDIDELRTDLLDLFDQLIDVQALLQKRKDDVQEILDEDRELASKAGITANGFDYVQKILDTVEEELQQVIADTSALINNIDCGEVPSNCTFQNTCGETTGEEDPTCVFTSEEDGGCAYCSFTVYYDDGPYTCEVSVTDSCTVDASCNEDRSNDNELYDAMDHFNSCNYTAIGTGGVDIDCNEWKCSGDVDWDLVNKACGMEEDNPSNPNCHFTCNYSTLCGEGQVPENCTFHDTSGNPCDYNYENCDYTSDIMSAGESGWSAVVPPGCTFDENGPCPYDQSNGINYGCSEYVSCSETITCPYTPGDDDCSDCSQGCDYNPVDDGVECSAGDNYDPSCDELNDSNDDDDGGNVICTYIINRLFDGELLSYYTQISNENVVLGFKGGFTKKLMKEYAYGLGPSIIKELEKETDSFLTELFLTRITPVWIELRRDPKSGYKMYTKFCKDMADRYTIDYSIYPHISEYYRTNKL